MKNIAGYFQIAATESPERVVLRFEDGNVHYGEMLQAVRSIRTALPKIRRVGLFAHRTPVAYAGLQAILSNGSTYVPIKPQAPAKYNALVLRLAEVSTVFVGEECADALGELLRHREEPLEIITHGPIERVRALAASRPDVTLRETSPVDPDSPPDEIDDPIDGVACILFTSGSTGLPKGVRVAHSNIDAYLDHIVRTYPVHTDDRLSQVFDLPFDCSLHDLFVTWRSKASMVVIPDRLILSPLEFANSHGVTSWYSAGSFPIFLESFNRAKANALPTVRYSMFAGEKLTWTSWQIWKKVTPNSRWINFYGPLETTIVNTEFEVPSDFPENQCHQGIIRIGKPFPGQLAEVRRPDGSICATREEGVLWMAGSQVTWGYLDPERTAESYVPKDGTIWYRTGDIVFEDEGGDLHFVGREDFQVKILGCRIELGEIEAILLRATGAPFAVADVLRGPVDELVAVLPTSCAPRKRELRELLKQTLDPFMVPRIWKFVDSLPRSSNGKIDRMALKASWKTKSEGDD